MKFQISPNGLALPPQTTKSPRHYGYLEVQYDKDRKRLQSCFTEMLNLNSVQRAGIQIDSASSDCKYMRYKLIYELAQLLLGDDFDYEQLC